jgi:hypothetical protein
MIPSQVPLLSALLPQRSVRATLLRSVAEWALLFQLLGIKEICAALHFAV